MRSLRPRAIRPWPPGGQLYAAHPRYLGTPCVSIAIRMASRKLAQFYDRTLQQAGITSAQFAVLQELRRAAGMVILAQLAKRLVIDRSALAKMLRPLEKSGLVEFSRTTDKRARYITLTGNGQFTLKKASKLWEATNADVETLYGASGVEELRRRLLRIAYDDRLQPGSARVPK